LEKVILQNEEVLTRLKSTDDHAMDNALKQSIIDGIIPSTPSSLAFTTTFSPLSMNVGSITWA
jgi:hypothetical protein